MIGIRKNYWKAIHVTDNGRVVEHFETDVLANRTGDQKDVVDAAQFVSVRGGRSTKEALCRT